MIQKIKISYAKIPDQVKASFWFTICGFMQKAITLLTTPIFSRFLTTEEYGIISVYNTWSSLLIIFASLNLASGGYLRGLIKYEDDSEEYTASLQSLFLFNFVLVFLVYFVFRESLNKIFQLPTIYVLLMFGDILFQVAFQFWSTRQRVNFRYRALVVVTLLNAILNTLLGIIVVLFTVDKALNRIITVVVSDGIVFSWLFLVMFIGRGKKVSIKYWKYALAYNLPLIPHYLSQLVLNQSDRLMINSMVGTSEAGIYSLAYSLAAVLTIVSTSILNTYNPWMYKQIRDKTFGNIAEISSIILVGVALINLMLIVFSPEIIKIFAPPAYYDAIWIIPPVSMSVFFMFLYSYFANIEFYYEKTKYMMVASVLGAALNVLLNYIFIEKYGYIAAGYTTLVCYLCYCIAHYILMKRILKKELQGEKIFDMKAIVCISSVFLVLGFIAMFLYNLPFLRYIIIGIVLITVIVKRKKVAGVIKTIFSLKGNGK